MNEFIHYCTLHRYTHYIVHFIQLEGTIQIRSVEGHKLTLISMEIFYLRSPLRFWNEIHV